MTSEIEMIIITQEGKKWYNTSNILEKGIKTIEEEKKQ